MKADVDYSIDQKLAVITKRGSAFGIKYLNILLQRNVKPQLIVVEKITLKRRYKLAKYLSKKIGLIDAVRYNIRFLKNVLKDLFKQYENVYKNYGNMVIYTEDINEERVSRIIQENKIEKVVLAHASILKSRVLLEGDYWIINSHPALLPKMRGVDVIKWSIFMREKLGITLHQVKRKIDAGEILEQVEVPIEASDTLTSLEDRIIDKSIEILVEATVKGPDQYKNFIKQNLEDGIQVYLMPFSIKRQLEQGFDKAKQYYLKEQTKTNAEISF